MLLKTVVPWKIIDRSLLPTVFFLGSFVAVLTFWQLLLGHRTLRSKRLRMTRLRL